MCDREQKIFDQTELANDALHFQAGCNSALVELLTSHVPMSAELEHQLMSVIEAEAKFGDQAKKAVDGIARSVFATEGGLLCRRRPRLIRSICNAARHRTKPERSTF